MPILGNALRWQGVKGAQFTERESPKLRAEDRFMALSAAKIT
jgi:hypothetical protein